MTARLHHYLPQCYLKRFTKGASKNSKLKAFDIEERRTFDTIPRNVGGVRDFNRIDIEGEQPDALETQLSQFEGIVGPALERVDHSSEFHGEDRAAILNLMAMMAVRSPHMREQMRETQANLMDRVLEVALASKERWDSQVRQMREAGYGDHHDVSYEDIKDFHESKEYRIEFAREHQIAMEFSGVEVVLPCLHERNWTLIRAPNDSSFITCDNPVMLSWIDYDKVPPMFQQHPGYGIPNTQVYFPLSNRHALIGEFDGHEGFIDANTDLVACSNTKALIFARKQLYAASTTFQIRGFDGETIHGSRLLKYIRDNRRGYKE